MTRAPGKLAVLALLAALTALAACDGRPGVDAGPAMAPVEPAAAVGVENPSPDGGGRPANAPPSAAAPQITLTLLGEIELPDGGVQRSYRATLQNGPEFLAGLRAQLLDAGPGRTVQQGLVRFGDVEAGGRAHADRLLLIGQRDAQPLDDASLRWALTPLDPLQGAEGALLPGAPDSAATEALRDYRWPGLPGPQGARLAAVLRRDAQVADVNQVLREAGLRITAMRPGNHTLELRSSRGGGEAALRPAAQRLEKSAAFDWVRLQPAAPAAIAALAAPADDPDACQD